MANEEEFNEQRISYLKNPFLKQMLPLWSN
jgi:hypothetical protein